MKISFNTRTVTKSELYMILDLVHELIDEVGLTKADEQHQSLASEFTSTLTGYTGAKQNDEFEPDDEEPGCEGCDPSGADRVYLLSPEAVANLTLTNTGDHKITVIEPGETTTVNVPVVPPPPALVSPPPSSSESQGISQGSSSYVDPHDSQPTELDSDGKLWDATVHSESHAKNADGTWRKRRVTKGVEVKTAVPGLETITPNSVAAPPVADRKMIRTFVRINGAQDFIAAPEGATDEELSVITGKPTVREIVETSGNITVVPPPPPAAPPVVKTAPQGAPAGTFAELMERVTKLFATQKITSKDLAAVCVTFAIGSIQECYAQPGLIPLVSNAIDAKAGV